MFSWYSMVTKIVLSLTCIIVFLDVDYSIHDNNRGKMFSFLLQIFVIIWTEFIHSSSETSLRNRTYGVSGKRMGGATSCVPER